MISPGCGGLRPPTSAAALDEWCGDRNGRRRHCAGEKPMRLADSSAAEVSASSSVSGGSSPGSRAASIDLPAPGGPTIRI